MAIKIERGVSRGAARVVLYGTEGIGKSTLAAQFPNPVILDTEDGTRQIDCARVRCSDWMTLQGAMVDLGGNAQGFETVVVDSVDWAERLALEHMLRKDGKRSVEDYGFGKGFVKLAEVMSAFLGMADNLIDRGVNVVFVGHSTVKRTTPPDLDEGWDRYELKLSRQVARSSRSGPTPSCSRTTGRGWSRGPTDGPGPRVGRSGSCSRSGPRPGMRRTDTACRPSCP